MSKCRLLVIGLDGASWNLLNPWIEDGYFPNIKKIRDSGVWSDMRSYLPPVTSPNWKCYSTGKNPGKFGVFWWEIIDREDRKVSIPLSTDYKSKEIWDYLGDSGFKSSIVNMPTTYPPRKLNGSMVAGGPTCPDEGFTYPTFLEEELKEKFDYHPNTREDVSKLKDRDSKVMGEITNMMESRFEAVRYVMEKDNYDFVHLTIFLINVLHHYLWNDRIVREAWEKIDREIGKMENISQNIFLMSDHGTNKIDYEFYINRWLENEGYLFQRNGGSRLGKFIGRLGLDRATVGKKLKKIPFGNKIMGAIPDSLKRKIPTQGFMFRKEGIMEVLDWDKSKAVASGQGVIYLLDHNGSINEQNEIIGKLKSLKDPSGNKVATEVYKKEEIYSGDYLSEAPDIVLEQSPHMHIDGGIGSKKVFKKPQKWKAENRQHGIFAASGGNIEKKGKIGDIRILDLAPTILECMGIPAPEDMNGNVLRDIFKEKEV